MSTKYETETAAVDKFNKPEVLATFRVSKYYGGSLPKDDFELLVGRDSYYPQYKVISVSSKN